MINGSKPENHHESIPRGPQPQTHSQDGHLNYNPDYQSQGLANETNMHQYYDDQNYAEDYYYRQNPQWHNLQEANQSPAPSGHMGANYPQIDRSTAQSETGDHYKAYSHKQEESMISLTMDISNKKAATLANHNHPNSGSTESDRMNRC